MDPAPKRQRVDPADAAGISDDAQAIRVLEFAKARAKELQEFAHAMMSSSRNRLATQLLPRHLRRRAASHNVYRLPARLRALAKQQALKSGLTKPSRRQRRKTRFLVDDHQRRARKNMWLASHIWHAKRMHMENLWGYRIAARSAERGRRAAYRAVRDGASLHDQSYMSPIMLESSEALLQQVLSRVVGQNFAEAILTSTRQRSCYIIGPDGQAIGQALVNKAVCINEAEDGAMEGDCEFAHQTEGSIILWVHPSSWSDVWQTVLDCTKCVEALHSGTGRDAKIEVKDLRLKFFRFRIKGSRSSDVMSDLLRLSCKECTQKCLLWRQVCNSPSPCGLIPGTSLALNVEDPRNVMPQQIRSRRTIKLVNASEDRQEAEQSAQSDSILPGFVDPISISTAASDFCETRLWRQVANSSVPQPEANSSVNARRSKKSLAPSAPPSDAARPSVYIMQQPGRVSDGFGAGWDIIGPAEWSMPVWMALIYRGCTAFGLREMHDVSLCEESAVFPKDNLSCSPGLKAIKAEFEGIIQKFSRRPKNQTPNLQKLRNEDGYSVPKCLFDDCGEIAKPRILFRMPPVGKRVECSDAQSGIVQGVCLSSSRGAPKFGARLYRPAESDFDHFNDPKYAGFTESKGKASDCAPSRHVVGFVTSGGYSLLHGHGVAMGTVDARGLDGLHVCSVKCKGTNRRRGVFLLAKNIHSRQFRPVHFVFQ